MWEKEKSLVTSNFSFSHSVFKRLVQQTRKNQGLFGKGLNVYQKLKFALGRVENIMGQGENAGFQHFLLFPKGFFLSEVKGGYLDFSHLTELKNIYITEIYMKKQFKSIITKNHKIKKIDIFHGVPLKGYVAS